MKWFKMDEFRCHCCGKIFSEENTISLVGNVLDPAREELGHSVRVSSGTRCENHNSKCKGAAKNSQHLRSEAADLVAGSPEENRKLARIIVKNGRFDQLIIYPTFVHVSWKRQGGNRKQILKKTATGYQRIDAASI